MAGKKITIRKILPLKPDKTMVRKMWQSRSARVSVFFLLVSLLTVTVLLLLPPVQNKLRELTHYRSMSGPVIADVPSEQYDKWEQGRGDCPETRMMIGSFDDTTKMGSLTFGFERLYVVKEINESYESDVVAEVKCTHLEGKDGFGQYIPNHKLQFMIVAQKDGLPLMNIYFSYDSYDQDGCFFYNAARYDEDEYRYESIHETFPWTTNGVYVHFVPCGVELRDEEMLLSRYGHELLERYNKREQEKNMADYTIEEPALISGIDSESLHKLNVSDLIEAIRPDRYVIAYIALGVSNYKNVQAIYNPDGDTVSPSDIAGKSWLYSSPEYDGYGYEYLCGDYRPGQLYSLCDRKYYTPPEKTEVSEPMYLIVDDKLEATEAYSKVFAPFLQIREKTSD